MFVSLRSSNFYRRETKFIFSPHNKEVGASTSPNNHTALTEGAVLTLLHDPLEHFRWGTQVSEVY